MCTSTQTICMYLNIIYQLEFFLFTVYNPSSRKEKAGAQQARIPESCQGLASTGTPLTRVGRGLEKLVKSMKTRVKIIKQKRRIVAGESL